MRWVFVCVLLVSLRPFANAQCPKLPYVQLPCACSTTSFGQVRIVCDRADNLVRVRQLLGLQATSVTIDKLEISNTYIPKLPAGAFQGYSIKHLVLRTNGLQEINYAAFEGPLLDNLTELEIRNNTLGSIPVSGVSALRRLTTLVLAKNRISTLPVRAFQPYQSKFTLRKLDLSDNRLRIIDQNAFVGLTAIREINLEKNFLKIIPTTALTQLSSLEDLSVAVNQIADVPDGSLRFANLKSLSLEVNKITSISAKTFEGIIFKLRVPNLLYLYLGANSFQGIPGNMFSKVPQLKTLAMGNNLNIRSISSSAFYHVTQLNRLVLSGCQIENIDSRAFQRMPKVQVIVLNGNKLRRVTRGLFRNLNKLVSLDLKGNNISHVEDRAFSALPALKYLEISGNKLQTLQPHTFQQTFEATQRQTKRILYIYENPWVCNKSLEWFRNWLRQNSDITIDAPGYNPAMCWRPTPLKGWPIKRLDPPFPTETTTVKRDHS